MSDYYKYPRTYHLPWSKGSTNDDKFLESTEPFNGKTMVISEKLDGENTNMYPDRIHARSMDSKDHPSRHWVKGLWGQIKHEIPDGWRICGENVYAKHSIFYDKLETYFYVISIWDENNNCLSWMDTVDICNSLPLIPVPELGIMVYDEEVLKLISENLDIEKQEGYVIRNIESFHFDDFNKNVGKWVREKHITTDQHWMFKEVEPNKLK